MKPHILMIAQYFPPDVAGTSTRVYNAAIGLKNQGCKVTVLTSFPHYPHGKIPEKYKHKTVSVEEDEGIKVIRTWVPAISHYTFSRRIILHGSFIVSSYFTGIFRIRDVDLIMSMNPSFFSFFPALMLKQFYGKEIIHNVDDLWPEVWYELGIVKSRLFKRILDWLAGYSYSVSVAVTPISRSYLQTLTSKYGVSADKIFVIEHGVDTSRFYHPSNAQKPQESLIQPVTEMERDESMNSEKTKTALNTTEEPGSAPSMTLSTQATENYQGTKAEAIIMYSGALSIGYDFEPVIKAAKILEGRPIKFILRGAGTSTNDIQNLKNMIHQLDVRNIEIRTERLSSEELVAMLGRADIFLLPMSFVGFDLGLPTKVLEYQALGKPIVCISNGEAADYVYRTDSGLVSRDRDAQKIAELIRRLVEDKSLAERLGNNGYDYVQENLTLQKIGERFMNVIKMKAALSLSMK